MGDEHLTVGEFTRLMDAYDKRNADRFSAQDGRLSALSHDVRDIRNATVDHQTRLAVIEASGKRANKRSWTAVITAATLAIIEGIRRFVLS
jgi:hypothetical protein